MPPVISAEAALLAQAVQQEIRARAAQQERPELPVQQDPAAHQEQRALQAQLAAAEPRDHPARQELPERPERQARVEQPERLGRPARLEPQEELVFPVLQAARELREPAAPRVTLASAVRLV